MSYWTLPEFKKTRKQINPVSRFWGETEKDTRPMICQCIDSMVFALTSQIEDIKMDGSFISDL